MKPIPYGRQLIEEDDIEAVVRVLRSDYLTTGPEVDAFERELAETVGARHAVVVSNGTAALHCAYAAAGVRAEDEVVTTALTFSATANMVLALGARPVFADIDPETLCLDPVAAARAITPRTRALAPVDFAGNPAGIGELMRLAESRGLTVIEDACHALGGRSGGKPVGSLAHMTVFSFHPVKTITTGEGGAIVTNDDKLAQRARDFRSHGMVRERERLARYDGPWFYEIASLGFNYRLTDLQCALGRSQLKKLERFTGRRTQIVARYRAAFAGSSRIRLQTPAPESAPSWHLFPIRLGSDSERAVVFGHLRDRGIVAQVHYTAVNDLLHYRQLGYDPIHTPNALAASRSIISLPLYPGMTDADVERVITATHESVDLAKAG